MDCFVVSVAYGTAASLILCSLRGFGYSFPITIDRLANSSSYIHIYTSRIVRV